MAKKIKEDSPSDDFEDNADDDASNVESFSDSSSAGDDSDEFEDEPKSKKGKPLAAAVKVPAQKKATSKAAPKAAASKKTSEPPAKKTAATTKSSAASKTASKGSTVVTCKSEKEAIDIILKYINDQNRPYNSQMVFDNLHGIVKKVMVPKILDKLAETGEISMKEWGKSRVYFCRQDKFQVPSPEDLKALDDQLTKLTATKKVVSEEVLQLQVEIKALESSMTLEEMTIKLQEVTDEIKKKQVRLEKLNQGGEVIDPTVRENIEKDYVLYRKEWRKRKRMCSNIADQIGESMSKKNSEIYELADVETDEQLSVAYGIDRVFSSKLKTGQIRA